MLWAREQLLDLSRRIHAEPALGPRREEDIGL
jgi:hypothetical protein